MLKKSVKPTIKQMSFLSMLVSVCVSNLKFLVSNYKDMIPDVRPKLCMCVVFVVLCFSSFIYILSIKHQYDFIFEFMKTLHHFIICMIILIDWSLCSMFGLLNILYFISCSMAILFFFSTKFNITLSFQFVCCTIFVIQCDEGEYLIWMENLSYFH